MRSDWQVSLNPLNRRLRGKAIARLECLESRRMFDAVSFTNPGVIAIPGEGTGDLNGAPANPYPSTIDVSGLSGSVSRVTVTVTDFSHTDPQDVNLLLVGPGGRGTLLMSNAGEAAANSVTFTFDDSVQDLIPTHEGPADGMTYHVTDVDAFQAQFPAPAPAGPYAALLSTFNGTDPNGQWSLYAVDDAPGDTGLIGGGWTLSITSDATPPTAMSSVFLYQHPPQSFQIGFTKSIGASLGPDDLVVTNLDTDEVMDPLEFGITYDATTNVATVTYNGGDALPDANYAATLKAGGLHDEANIPLDGNGDGVGGDDLVFYFFNLKGDVNRDTVVNALDFNALATDFGATKATWQQGDLTGDEHVDSRDFDVLASNFNQSLPVLQPAPHQSASLFADHPVQISELDQLL